MREIKNKTGKGPKGRKGCIMVNIFNKIVIQGGFDNSFKVFNDLWTFDLKREMWIKCELINSENGDGENHEGYWYHHAGVYIDSIKETDPRLKKYKNSVKFV